MRGDSRFARPSMSLRQSPCSSHATENQLTSCAPAADIRAQAACCTVSLKVPEASVTTNTSKPSARADKVGNVTHTSVTTPAMINCLRPVSLTALTKSALSQALIWPGRGMYGASGNSSLSSGTIGPFGPFSKLVVRMVGSLKNLARSARASTLFLNSLGEKSCTSEIRPVWWSTSRTTASSLFKRLRVGVLMVEILFLVGLVWRCVQHGHRLMGGAWGINQVGGVILSTQR